MIESAERTVVVIAVDGPAASGKGTLARRLANHFGYAYLDTGLLYRAVGLGMLRAKKDPADDAAASRTAAEITPEDLDDPALRDDKTANAAGIVAANPAVRKALLGFQHDFIARPPGGAPGVVLDGRDIGTVICPDADHKIFVDAAPEIRAERRLKELQARGVESIPSRVLQDMTERDTRDRNRGIAPLVPSGDACMLETSSLDADAAFAAALEFITSRNRSPA
ncbi:MAG: (d)CMP kinase [Alphaproteobacteria bacterium]